MKDTEDLKLESLFAQEAVPDNGFSVRIEKRIRRGIWLRRLLLPAAVLVGGAISAKPLVGLVQILIGLFGTLPASVSDSFAGASSVGLPELSTIMFACMAAIAVVMISRMLEE